MRVLMECGRVFAGLAPRRNTLAAWIAGTALAFGLTAVPVGVPLVSVAVAQPVPAAPTITWTDQTWVICPDGAGNWALMLAMTYDKEGRVVLPVGIIAGLEKNTLTTSNPPPTSYMGFVNTSIVQSRLEGTLFLNAGLIAAMGLEPSHNGGMISVRWNYNHPTEGGAFVQVGSLIGLEWEPILAKIRLHYEATINPSQLPEWDISATNLQDKHDEPGRVKRPAGGGRWSWVWPTIGILWDLLSPSTTPPPAPPAPNQAPGNPQDIANCRAAVTRASDHHSNQCALSACPPAQRQACVSCVQAERDLQFSNCDRNQPVTSAGMLACTNIVCP